MLSKRAGLLKESGIRKVFNLLQDLKNPINFSIGQTDYDVPEVIKQSAIKAINNGFNKYTVTKGIAELREKLTHIIERRWGKKPEDILITSGTSGGILLAMFVLIDEGDEVILQDPYFVLYDVVITLAGGVPKYINTYPDFKIKPEKLRSAISSKTKLLIINSPNNPTGVVYNKAELEAIIKVAREFNLSILSDEIYDAFDYDNQFYSVFPLYEKAVIVSGFSKTYGMTGWRLGYALAPKEVIDKMANLQQFTFVCAPSFAQKAAIDGLNLDMSAYVERYRKKRDLVCDMLEKGGFEFIRPQGAFYVFPKIPNGYSNSEEFVKRAAENNILLVPGNAFSKIDTHFRLSFACSDDDLKRGIEMLVNDFRR